MGCVISTEKKVIPSDPSPKRPKSGPNSSRPTITEAPNSQRINQDNSSAEPSPNIQDPRINQAETDLSLKEARACLKLYINSSSFKPPAEDSKQVTSVSADDGYHKEEHKVGSESMGNSQVKADQKVIMSGLEEDKKGVGSTRNGCSMVSLDSNEVSKLLRVRPMQLSLGEFGRPSTLLTSGKFESRRSTPLFPGAEDRGSMEELSPLEAKKDNVNHTPTLGLIEAVEEVSMSRELPTMKVEDGSKLHNESTAKKEQVFVTLSNIGDIVDNEKKSKEEHFGTGSGLVASGGVIKNVSRHLLHLVPLITTEEGRLVRKTTTEAIEKGKEGNKNEHHAVEPKNEEKLKVQMKARFTRNLVQLVAADDSSSSGEEDNYQEPKKDRKTPTLINGPGLGRGETLSLDYSPAAETEVPNNLNLDLKMVRIFEDTDGFSPIYPNKMLYGETTPIVTLDHPLFRNKRITENSILYEEKTITNLEDGLSKLDFENYSLVAEVKQVEFDEEKNGYYRYIYGGSPKVYIPHAPIKKSGFAKRFSVFNERTTTGRLDSPQHNLSPAQHHKPHRPGILHLKSAEIGSAS